MPFSIGSRLMLKNNIHMQSFICVNRYKKLRKSANVYVVNLASVDVLMCIANFPLFVYSCFEGTWVTGYTSESHIFSFTCASRCIFMCVLVFLPVYSLIFTSSSVRRS